MMQACELKSLNRKVAKPLRLRKVRLQNIPPLAYSLRRRDFAVQLLDHLDFLNLSDLPKPFEQWGLTGCARMIEFHGSLQGRVRFPTGGD